MSHMRDTSTSAVIRLYKTSIRPYLYQALQYLLCLSKGPQNSRKYTTISLAPEYKGNDCVNNSEIVSGRDGASLTRRMSISILRQCRGLVCLLRHNILRFLKTHRHEIERRYRIHLSSDVRSSFITCVFSWLIRLGKQKTWRWCGLAQIKIMVRNGTHQWHLCRRDCWLELSRIAKARSFMIFSRDVESVMHFPPQAKAVQICKLYATSCENDSAVFKRNLWYWVRLTHNGEWTLIAKLTWIGSFYKFNGLASIIFVLSWLSRCHLA